MREAVQRATTVAEQISDVFTVILAVVTSYAIYSLLQIGRDIRYPATTIVEGSAVFAFALVMMLALDGAYQRGNSLLRVRETERILRASAGAF